MQRPLNYLADDDWISKPDNAMHLSVWLNHILRSFQTWAKFRGVDLQMVIDRHLQSQSVMPHATLNALMCSILRSAIRHSPIHSGILLRAQIVERTADFAFIRFTVRQRHRNQNEAPLTVPANSHLSMDQEAAIKHVALTGNAMMVTMAFPTACHSQEKTDSHSESPLVFHQSVPSFKTHSPETGIRTVQSTSLSNDG